MPADLVIERGWTDRELADEFPGLALHIAAVDAAPSRRSPRPVKDRLRAMSDRYTGGKAVNLRQEPIPWAYRVFFRQIGIDPDDRPTPAEEIALERMKWGGFRSRTPLDDALMIATVETGVALFALDAGRVEGPPGTRLSHRGERLGVAPGEDSAGARRLSSRQIVVADSVRSLAVLFGDMAEGRGVHSDTTHILLCAVQVSGVPQVSVEEALWVAAEALHEAH